MVGYRFFPSRLTKLISGSMIVGWLGQPCACRRGNLVLESSNGITTEYVLDERGALPTILGAVRSDGTTRLYA